MDENEQDYWGSATQLDTAVGCVLMTFLARIQHTSLTFCSRFFQALDEARQKILKPAAWMVSDQVRFDLASGLTFALDFCPPLLACHCFVTSPPSLSLRLWTHSR